MIQIFIGEDTQRARKATREAFDAARGDNSEALAARFDDMSFDFALAADAFNSENLFGGGNILFFDGILEHPEGESFYRTVLKETGHLVFIRETAPSKDLLAFFGRIGEVKEFLPVKKFEKRENSFAIADAIGRRDKKAAWVEFEKVRRHSAAIEEVHGTIFWAFKSMFIAGVLGREEALASGMKEFTYRNYTNFAKKYLVPELKQKLGELKEMYHLAHRGEGDFEIMLEQFLLTL